MNLSLSASPKLVKPALLVSIHDVSPLFETEVKRLYKLLSGLLDSSRIAMLVVPDYWNSAPLEASPDFCNQLREWSDAGSDMFVHGWYHRDDGGHTGLSRLKAETMTAGAGEFLGLSREEAASRMKQGRSLIEGFIGRPVAGFIAPAWLYGKGALDALDQSEFALAEDHFNVWRPGRNEVLVRGPVITWATRSPARQLSSRFFASLSTIALNWSGVVRIAVHPADIHDDSVVKSIVKTVSHFSSHRTLAGYSDLINSPS